MSEHFHETAEERLREILRDRNEEIEHLQKEVRRLKRDARLLRRELEPTKPVAPLRRIRGEGAA